LFWKCSRTLWRCRDKPSLILVKGILRIKVFGVVEKKRWRKKYLTKEDLHKKKSMD